MNNRFIIENTKRWRLSRKIDQSVEFALERLPLK